MALVESYQANDFPGTFFSDSMPRNYALQNVWIPLAPANDQPDSEGHRENIPPQATGVAEPGRRQDPAPHFDVAHQGIVNYCSQPLNSEYNFPNVGLAQGIAAQAQPNTPVNLECNPFDYVSHHNTQDPAQAVFPHPSVHRNPTADQGGAENLRQLASRYLHHPNVKVDTICMEAGTGGRLKLVIVLESLDVL